MRLLPRALVSRRRVCRWMRGVCSPTMRQMRGVRYMRHMNVAYVPEMPHALPTEKTHS